MGQSQSRLNENTKSKYKQKINNLKKVKKQQKKQVEGFNKNLNSTNIQNSILNSKLDQLKSVCLIDRTNSNLNKKDLLEAGKKVYKLISNKARQNLSTLNRGQHLIDKNDRILGIKNANLLRLHQRLENINSKIQISTRKLLYNNQIYSRQNLIIAILKTSITFSILILIIYIILKLLNVL